MATLSSDNIRHIAKLARLTLKDEEVGKFSKELTAILEYVDQLAEVNTDGVDATAQVTGLTNVNREDIVKESEALTQELLRCSPLPVMNDQIETLSSH